MVLGHLPIESNLNIIVLNVYVLPENFTATLLRQLNAPRGVASNSFRATLRKLEMTLAFHHPCGLVMMRHLMVVASPNSFQLTSNQSTDHFFVAHYFVTTRLLSLITFKSLPSSLNPPLPTSRKIIALDLMESFPFLSKNVQPPSLNLCCFF